MRVKGSGVKALKVKGPGGDGSWLEGSLPGEG